jgi:hypothetical protein
LGRGVELDAHLGFELVARRVPRPKRQFLGPWVARAQREACLPRGAIVQDELVGGRHQRDLLDGGGVLDLGQDPHPGALAAQDLDAQQGRRGVVQEDRLGVEGLAAKVIGGQGFEGVGSL